MQGERLFTSASRPLPGLMGPFPVEWARQETHP
jgi:hypothetical protein